MRSNKAGLAELALLLKKARSESVLAEQTSRVPSERPQTRCHRPEEETGLFFLALRNVTPLVVQHILHGLAHQALRSFA